MYNLPVYESISGFVFRNVFCQLCVDPLWELKTCSSIDNFFGKRTETSFGFLLDFRNLDEADNDRLQCDVDFISDTHSVCIFQTDKICRNLPIRYILSCYRSLKIYVRCKSAFSKAPVPQSLRPCHDLSVTDFVYSRRALPATSETSATNFSPLLSSSTSHQSVADQSPQVLRLFCI